MSAPLVAGAVCGRPECGHGEDLHDGICFGTACECVRFVEPAGAMPVPVGPEPQGREAAKARVRAKVEASRAMPARERIYHLLCATYTHAEAEAMLAEVDGSAELALPWAHRMPDGDLSGFLDDLVSAAMGRWRSEPEVPDRTVLADIEKVCADWRTPGEGYRSDPESESAPDAVATVFVPVASLREPDGEFYGLVHHDWRLGRDLPEAGGTR